MQAQNIFSTKIDAPIASWNCRDLHGNKHVPPPLGHNDNAGEVIVERSDVRSLLGHLRAFKSHRGAHVRIPMPHHHVPHAWLAPPPHSNPLW